MSTNRNIHDVIVEKIHSQFVELVPEDELRSLVEETITKFKTPVRVKGNNWTPEKINPSPLEEMVYAAIDGLMKNAIQKHINEALAPNFDEAGSRVASEVLEKIVQKSAPIIMQHFIASSVEYVAGNAVQHLRNDLNQKGLLPW